MAALADSLSRADRWEEGFRRLLCYIERRGDACAPNSYVLEGYRLGKWVTLQRHVYSKGTLDANREHRLNRLPGWTWDRRADRWEEGFHRLLGYVERHGDARVRQSSTVDGYRLGVWVATQRHNYAQGVLGPHRQDRLQHLPGRIWDAQSST